MIICYKHKKNTIKFYNDVEIGQCFEYNRHVYIKSNFVLNGRLISIRLSDGMSIKFFGKQKVFLIENPIAMIE